MRILVLGAGATGGYFGGRLAAAGADVAFLVRPPRAERLAAEGLVVRSPHGDLRLPVTAVTADRPGGPYDVVVLSCKAYDLDAAIQALRPAVGAGTRVLPLLNGLCHLDALDAAFGAERVLGGVCHIAATLAPDGAIVHLNRTHALTFGSRDQAGDPVAVRLAEAMDGAGFDARLTSAILQHMWEKFVMLTALAGITCLMRASVGAIVEAQDGEALTLELLDECAAVAAASGYAPRPDALERTRATLTERGSAFTASMLRDIERGGPIEADHIVGDMYARARALSVPSPLLRVAYCHLQAYEARRG